MRIRTILAAAAAPAALAAVLLGTAGQASAAVNSQQFTTHFNQHPDTTSGVTGATLSSDGGPVWAFDNVNVKLIVTPEDPATHNGDNWHVAATTTGSFHGFADPLTGAALQSEGSTKGSISYDVKSTQGPNGANLPAQQPLPTVDPSANPQVVTPTHLSDTVQELFPNGTIDWTTSGQDWVFNYQNGNYVQDYRFPAPFSTGDVQGH